MKKLANAIRIYPADRQLLEDNIASQKILEKCGFKATGEIGEEGPGFIVYKE